jgi:hypothetical protein
MKKAYTVVLPIEVAGIIYQHGATVELADETAALYSHALRANETAGANEETHGSHS